MKKRVEKVEQVEPKKKVPTKVQLKERDLRGGKVCKYAEDSENEDAVEVVVEFNNSVFVVKKNGHPIHLSKNLPLIEGRVRALVEKYELIEKK